MCTATIEADCGHRLSRMIGRHRRLQRLHGQGHGGPAVNLSTEHGHGVSLVETTRHITIENRVDHPCCAFSLSNAGSMPSLHTRGMCASQ